ncbi:MAG: leucine-rich repeat domain-containing protein, partial [Clostridiales bacterium]|nr:leucine-rich repeat domain-containing protein [Clostridiales bacterium]
MSKKVNIEYDSDEFYIDGTILFRYYGDGGEVVVPDGIDTVEAEAFIDTEEVTSITFPKTFRSINGHAFAGCVNLEKFSFAEPNEIFHTIDGNVYRENGAVLATYAVGKKDAVFTVPETVKVIEAQAFYHADF